MKEFLEHHSICFCCHRRLARLIPWRLRRLLIALILFAVTDYITGFMCRVADKNSPRQSASRDCRKVLIFIMVGIANALDIYVLNHAGVLRTAIIFFYISNEGLSLVENSVHLGLPVPDKLKEVLEQLHDRESTDTKEDK